MTPTADSLQGFRNRIINGAMVIDQRNAGASVNSSASGNHTYTLDRWFYLVNPGSKFTIQQNAGSVTPPTGFSNYFGVTSSSSYSIGASEYEIVGQKIEGFNFADLAWGTASAKTITISFWIRSSLTGNFGGFLRNNANNRFYVFSYTISSANTWEYKTVTIVGDTSGTWVGATNGTGLDLNFNLGIGSTYNGTVGSWTSTVSLGFSGAVSVVGTNGATWYITGVQLEVGSVATPFERRDYGRELAMCQRYYYRITTVNQQFGVGWNGSTTGSYVMTTFPVTMRTAPTAVEQNGTAINYRVLHTITATDCSVVPSFGRGTIYSAITEFTVASGLTAGQGSAGAGAANGNAYLGWSAEL
jgi:hypothetical protein